RDEQARDAAAEEVPQVRCKKRQPETGKALFELEAARDQINCKPVGDEEPNGIREALGDDVAPRLRQAQEHAVRNLLARLGRLRETVSSIRENVAALLGSETRVIL